MTAPVLDPKALARRRRLFIAAAATLAATAWVALHGDDDVAPSRPDTPTTLTSTRVVNATTAARPPSAWPSAPRPTPWPEPPASGVVAWGPPPPPPPPPPAPPPRAVAAVVQAPPFPYTVIGRLDDGVPRILLSGRQRSFGAKATDVIDGAWRVDAIRDGNVAVTWLPGGIHRNLDFPSS